MFALADEGFGSAFEMLVACIIGDQPPAGPFRQTRLHRQAPAVLDLSRAGHVPAGVQVTAYGGEDADHCKVVSWTTGGADFSANVRCYNHLGALSDNRFDLLFVW